MSRRTRRVVAVQLAVGLGEIERNLDHIADIVTQAAREHAPDMVFLPEVSTTPNLNHRAMRHCVGPVDGRPLALYRRLAREHGCVVGAGALTIRGRDARNTYYVCEPGGAVHLHDKDQPSMWENATYAAGRDPGILTLSGGPIGCANGFEWARSRTAARLRGEVRLVAGGMCFPSFPRWRATKRYFWDREHRTMLQLARETPGRMARVVGAPAVHPSHVGEVAMETPYAPWLGWPTIMLGETIITDADGAILERLAYEDGEGYICADVAWADPRPRDPVPPGFWLAPMPVSVQAIWHAENTRGRLRYLTDHALRRHPFQHDAAYGRDLPDDLPPRAAGSPEPGSG